MLLTFYKETFSEKQDKKAVFRFGSAVIGVYKIIVAQINVSVNTLFFPQRPWNIQTHPINWICIGSDTVFIKWTETRTDPRSVLLPSLCLAARDIQCMFTYWFLKSCHKNSVW